MAVRLTLLFLLVIAVAVFMQVIFYSSSQISCESDTVSNRYAECFCISNPQNLRASNDKDSLRFYGWLQFFALLQAILLYIPYSVGAQLDSAKQNLTLPSRYILEIPVIMTLIGVIWISDKILGGNFLLLGVKVIANACNYYSPQPPPPPLVQIFPMMATCQVESYNSNSTYMATCYLPMNELNSYAFLALWFIYFISMACSLYTLTIVVGKIIKNALTRQRPKANGDNLAEYLLANEEPVASEECSSPNKKYNRPLNLIVKPVTYDRVHQKV